jgi:hypothetical protein
MDFWLQQKTLPAELIITGGKIYFWGTVAITSYHVVRDYKVKKCEEMKEIIKGIEAQIGMIISGASFPESKLWNSRITIKRLAWTARRPRMRSNGPTGSWPGNIIPT